MSYFIDTSLSVNLALTPPAPSHLPAYSSTLVSESGLLEEGGTSCPQS